MDFDKSKVYTVMTANEVEVGSKGYYADCPKDLEERVNSDDKKHYGTVAIINPSCETYRFKRGDAFEAEYALFYLVKEPEKKKLRPYRDTDEMVDHFCRHFNLIPQDHRLPPCMRHDVFFYLAQIRILPQPLRLVVDEDRARDDARLHARNFWKSAELLLYLALELQIAQELLAAQADAPRQIRSDLDGTDE